jgi:hypothetical protein
MVENWRDKAARLLGLSMQARQAGDGSLADVLVEAADRAYQFADRLDARPRSAPIQQQQQIQPKKNGSSDRSIILSTDRQLGILGMAADIKGRRLSSAACSIRCPSCDDEMRLVGIETESDIDLYTFDCERCGKIEVRG